MTKFMVETQRSAEDRQLPKATFCQDEEISCKSNECYFGMHGECPDVFANCCECNCHIR